MMQSSDDLDQLRAVLNRIGSRLATDPNYREQLRAAENQPAALHAAGLSTALLSGVLQEAGAEESDVAGFDMGLGNPMGPGDPQAIVVNGHCVTPGWGSGSCKNLTLEITIKTRGPNN